MRRVTTCGGSCGGHGVKDFGSFDYGVGHEGGGTRDGR